MYVFFSDIVQSINEIALKQSTQTLQVVRSAADRAERRQWKKTMQVPENGKTIQMSGNKMTMCPNRRLSMFWT